MFPDIVKRPTATHIDLDALAFNFRSAKQFIGTNVKYMAVVKADGYGHGAVRCALRLEREGIDWFGVAIPEEGLELRLAGVKTPILCLGSVWPGQETFVVENTLTAVVFDLDTAKRLDAFSSERGMVTDVHVKVDTGMGRVGIPFCNAAAFARALKAFSHLRVNGLMTHFAAAEDPSEDAFTTLQISRLDTARAEFRAEGHDPQWIDMANSPAAITHPGSRGDLVRLGGALYGLLDDILPEKTHGPVLQPVLSLHSCISGLRQVPVGYTLGYGRTFVAERPTRVALVPIGYADGYPRALSNKGRALINGHIAPVVGRISMDWTLLDVTDIPNVGLTDRVTLIGRTDGGSVTAGDIARLTNTIGYEITCGISPRVPRIYLENA